MTEKAPSSEQKELARLFLEATHKKISPSTIVKYDDIGLLPAPATSSDGEEMRDRLERLGVLEAMREKYGMELTDMAALVAAGAARTGPREHSREQPEEVSRRQPILRNAARLFSEKGYRGTTVDDIVQATGIAKGTFYIYFKSKEDLLIEVIKNLIAETVVEIEDSLAGEKDFIRRMMSKGQTFTRLYAENRDLFSVLIGETVGNPRLLHQLDEVYNALVDPVRDDLRVGIEKLGVRDYRDLDTIAYALIGMSQMIGFRLSEGVDVDLNQALETLAFFLRRALLKD